MTPAHPTPRTPSTWQLRPARKGHIEIKANAKPAYLREMEVKAEWVQDWQQAVAAGNTNEVARLEGLLGTSPVKELRGKR